MSSSGSRLPTIAFSTSVRIRSARSRSSASPVIELPAARSTRDDLVGARGRAVAVRRLRAVGTQELPRVARRAAAARGPGVRSRSMPWRVASRAAAAARRSGRSRRCAWPAFATARTSSRSMPRRPSLRGRRVLRRRSARARTRLRAVVRIRDGSRTSSRSDDRGEQHDPDRERARRRAGLGGEQRDEATVASDEPAREPQPAISRGDLGRRPAARHGRRRAPRRLRLSSPAPAHGG